MALAHMLVFLEALVVVVHTQLVQGALAHPDKVLLVVKAPVVGLVQAEVVLEVLD